MLSMCSAHLSIGRFDIDLPLEVDDEFWGTDNAKDGFKQPEGKPSVIEAFNSRIRLSQVLAFAIRTVVCDMFAMRYAAADSRRSTQCATEKSKNLLGLTGRHWKEKVVSELNSALTEWAKSVPGHRLCFSFPRIGDRSADTELDTQCVGPRRCRIAFSTINRRRSTRTTISCR